MKIYSCFPNPDTLDFWIKNGWNALFWGRHGVGKTSMILEAFERNGLKFKQFSAATMDPWVDFIGVPKEQMDEKGPFLELVRPKDFRDDEVEAIFFDELNRSHKKVRNAVMELIQFKSINGKKYPHLKFIWGAVNPDEDDELKYDVEKIDPAQWDRFQVQIEIPYKPYMPYFTEKYGKEIAQAAVDWWTQLSDEIKKDISPRRLEYALQSYKAGGNLVHILTPRANIDKLTHALKNGSPTRDFKELLRKGKEDELKKWLSDENNYAAVKGLILKNPEPVLHLIEEEKTIAIASISQSVADFMFANYSKFEKIINSIAENSQNKTLKKQAISVIQSNTGKENNDRLLDLKKPKPPSTVKNAKSIVSSRYVWNPNCNLKYSKYNRKPYNLEKSIQDCIGACLVAQEQTNERIRICNSVIRLIGAKTITSISKEEAHSSLNVLDWVASKTTIPTLLNKTENLGVCINVCTMVLRGAGGFTDVTDFTNKYPFISGKIIHSMGTAGIDSGKCFVQK